MSSAARPISSARFAEALTSLPVSSLHAKAAELRNSIAHLEASNSHLKDYVDAGDQDCEEASRGNISVIARMRERIELVRTEVHNRGGVLGDGGPQTNGKEAEMVHDAEKAGESVHDGQGGRLTDEELAERLRERMEEHVDGASEGETGLHL